jgi:hypothetical protein
MDRTWQSAEYDSCFVPYHHDQVDHHHREHKKSTLCFTLCTIMTLLLPLLTLYTLLHEFRCGKVRVAKWQNKVCTWRGKTNEHTTRVSCRRRFPVYESPRWVNDMDLEFMGSAQGVLMELRCRQWQSMPARDPNSPPQYAHLKPKEIGNFFLPPGIPPPALLHRCMLWSFQFAASPGPWSWVSDEVASTACNTVNTTQKIRTGQCISLVGSVA